MRSTWRLLSPIAFASCSPNGLRRKLQSPMGTTETPLCLCRRREWSRSKPNELGSRRQRKLPSGSFSPRCVTIRPQHRRPGQRCGFEPNGDWGAFATDGDARPGREGSHGPLEAEERGAAPAAPGPHGGPYVSAVSLTAKETPAPERLEPGPGQLRWVLPIGRYMRTVTSEFACSRYG